MLNAYLENTLVFRQELCNGCQMCCNVCPHGVFAPNGKVVEIILKSLCMECGACQQNCPTDAIAVESGVGCATAMFLAALKGKKDTECNCG